MSSYVIEKQSRGAGAIAAHDLGAVSRASGSAFKSRRQMRSAARAPAQAAPVTRSAHPCPPGQTWDQIERMCRTFGRPAPKPVFLTARMRATATAKPVPFVQGRAGRALSPRGTVNATDFLVPVRDGQTTAAGTATSTKIIDLIDRPVVPSSAGIMSGSLPAIVAARNNATDVFDEIEEGAAALQVPQISAPKSNKLLIYGGLGAAAVLAYYLMRKR